MSTKRPPAAAAAGSAGATPTYKVLKSGAGGFRVTGGANRRRDTVTAQDWVEVRTDEMKRIMNMVDNTPYLHLCLSRLTTALTGKGVTMKLWEFGREVDLGDEHIKVIKKVWGEGFYPKFVRYMWAFGVVVCAVISHPDYPEGTLDIPYVVPFNKYTLRFSESSTAGRRYWVHFNDDNELWESDANGTQMNPNNAGYPLPNGTTSHLIFAFSEWEPSEIGVIRAPMRYAAEEYLYIQRMMRNADRASFWRAWPLNAVTVDKNVLAGAQQGNLPPFPTDHFAEGDAYMQEEEYLFRRNAQEQQQFQDALDTAHKKPKDDAKDPFQRKGAPDQSPSEAPNPHAQHSPLEHYVVLGVNQRLAAGPVPVSHDQFQAVLDYSRDIVNAIFGFPKGVTTSKAGQDKAGAESNNEFRAWDDKVQGWIQKITEVFNELYLAVYFRQHREYVNRVYKVIRQDTKELVRRGEVLDASDLPKDDITELMDDQQKKTISDTLKAARKQGLKQLISDAVVPEFNVGYVPNITLMELKELMDMLIINEENFVQYAALLYHIPPEKVLTQAEREKERSKMEEQALHQQEEGMRMQAKYTPDKGPPKPGAPKGAVQPVDISPSSMLHKGTAAKPGAKSGGGGK